MVVKPQPLIWRAIRKTWREFANDTSIHGIKYSIGRRRIDRWIWTLVLFASSIGASIMVVIMYQGYFKEPTRAIYESQFAPLDEFAFPGITICAPRKFNQVYIKKLMKKFKMPPNVVVKDVEKLLPSLLGFTLPISTDGQNLTILDEVFVFNKIEPQDVMKALTPRCKKIIKRCRWQGSDVECKKFFKRTKTKEGYCCSFNYDTNFMDAKFESVHTPYFGPVMGLSIVVDTIGLYNRQIYHNMDSFKILVHNSQSFAGGFTPQIIMPLQSEMHVTLSFLKIKIGTQAILLSPENRHCYGPFEFPLKHFALYRKSDCLVECEIEKSVERCGCQPFMYPRDNDDIVCNASSIPCLKLHFRQVQSISWGKDCNCPPQCNENTTGMSTDTTDLKGIAFNSDPLFNALTENQTIIHFYAGKQYGNIVRKAVIIYWVDLISSFGGVFNLFLGCSFLSVLEIVYYIFVKFPKTVNKMWRQNKKIQDKTIKAEAKENK